MKTFRWRVVAGLVACAAAGCESPQSGEVFDAALLSDGRVAAVGYIGLDSLERPALTVLGADGAEQWVRYLGSSGIGGLEVGTANRVTVDDQDRIVVAGFVRAEGGGDAGVVAAYGEDGGFLWQARPFEGGESEIRGVTTRGGDVVVTGFARVAGASGEADTQGVLTAKLRGSDGALLWSDVLAAGPDRLHVTSGLAIDVSASGDVGVTGCATAADGHSDWLAASWSAAGSRNWVSRRRGGGDLGQDAGDLSVAVKGGFDVDGSFYAAGTLFEGLEGSNAELAKYTPGGAIEWTRSTGVTLPDGLPSYDRAGALAIGDGRVHYGGAVATSVGGWLLDESFVAAVSAAGDTAWTSGFPGVALSGEEVFDIAAAGNGAVYVAGTASIHGYGRDLAVMKLTEAGDVVWSESLDGVASILDLDRIERIVAREDGLIAVGKIDWGFGAHVAAVVKLDPVDGALLWAYPETLQGNQKIHVVR